MAKLTCGVGFNSGGKYKAINNNKHTRAYRIWNSMLTRCYRHEGNYKNRTYLDCTVHPDWHDFQVFAEWFLGQYLSSQNYVVDKDILIPNNKVYSSDACCLVPSEINNLFVSRDAKRGNLPQGVSLNKNKKRFITHIRINSKSKHLGVFDTPEEAHQVYRVAKEANVKRMAIEWKDRIEDNVFQALMNWELV